MATSRGARVRQSVAPDQRLSDAALSEFHSHIEGIAGSLVPISEREYVQRALDLANWSGRDYSRFRDLEAAVRVSTRDIASDANSRPLNPDNLYTPGAVSTGQERAIAIRDLFRATLREIAADIKAFRRHKVRDRNLDPAQVIAIPVMRLVGKGLEIGHVYWSLHAVAALNLVEGLLVDRRRQIGDDLRQCQLSSCGRLFLRARRPDGKYVLDAPRKFHDVACMKVEHDLKASYRVAASRAGVPLKVWMQRKRQVRKS